MKKIKSSIIIVLALVGLFTSFNTASARTPDFTCNSATIYGNVGKGGYSDVTAWFEWGNNRTTVQNGGGTRVGYQRINYDTEISANISGLTQNTTYYYRAAILSDGDLINGTTESFTTSTCTPVATAPIITLTADSYNLNYNSSTTLRWSTTGTTPISCTASGTGWSGTKTASGTQSTGNLTSQKTYTLTCSNSRSSDTKTITINVDPQHYGNPTLDLTTNHSSINSGESSTINWTSQNTNSCSASWTTSHSTSGYKTVYPTTTTDYTMTCQGLNGTSITDTTRVTVNSTPSQTTGTINVSPPSCIIPSGSAGCNVNANWSTINPNNGVTSTVDILRVNRTYGNVASGNSGSGILVYVKYPSETFYLRHLNNILDSTVANATCASGSHWVNDHCAQDTTISQNPTVTLSATNPNLISGGSTYITWTLTNATSCTASGGSNGWTGPKDLNTRSFYTGILTNTTTYTITCYGEAGTSPATSSTTIYIDNNQNQTPTVSTNAASGIGTNYAVLNGYINSNGGTNTYAWFEWGTSSYYGNQTNQISYGSTSGTPYSYNLSGLSENTTYYYRAVARGNNGQNIYGSQMAFSTSSNNNYNCSYYGTCYNTTQPTVTTYSASVLSTNSATLNGYINTNSSSATKWFEYGTSNNYLYTATNKTSQSYSGNFSESIYSLNPNTTYYYRAVAQGSTGVIIYGNILTFTTSNTYYNTCTYGTCTPTAITSMATNIGNSSARINGLGLVNNSIYTTGYFEYGPTQALGRVTTTKNIGSTQSNPFYESLFSLASGTTFYYRAVVSNQYGTSRGDILSFTTGNPITYVDTTTHTNTIYRNTTVVTNTIDNSGTARPSLVFLSVSRNGEIIRRGDMIEYIINYKNVSSKNLRDIVLQIYIPKELDFIETSRGYFSSENSTVVANIGNLIPQEEGSVRVLVKVNTDAEIGKIIVVTANLAYTINNTNTQEEVFAYSKNTIENGNATIQLGALAFLFGDGFLPNTLLGWLLLILLIVLLVLAARKAYYGPQPILLTKNSKKIIE